VLRPPQKNSNFGNANRLGAFTGTAEFYPNFCEDPPNITYTGMFHWFAANGDIIEGTFDGYLTDPDMDGVYDNYETAEVKGGTGRFANATGTFYLGGQIDFTTNPPSFVLPWHGTISSVGLDEALEIARLICASQLAFVELRCAGQCATSLGPVKSEGARADRRMGRCARSGSATEVESPRINKAVIPSRARNLTPQPGVALSRKTRFHIDRVKSSF
jgi:hypothetical protein